MSLHKLLLISKTVQNSCFVCLHWLCCGRQAEAIHICEHRYSATSQCTCPTGFMTVLNSFLCRQKFKWYDSVFIRWFCWHCTAHWYDHSDNEIDNKPWIHNKQYLLCTSGDICAIRHHQSKSAQNFIQQRNIILSHFLLLYMRAKMQNKNTNTLRSSLIYRHIMWQKILQNKKAPIFMEHDVRQASYYLIFFHLNKQATELLFNLVQQCADLPVRICNKISYFIIRHYHI